MTDIEPADLALTQRAYAQFRQRCPGLGKLSPLIEQITVNDQAFVLNEGAQSPGWTIAISIDVKFRQSANHTAFTLGIPLMSDYMFMVGSGREPGVLSMASDGLKLCISQYQGDFLSVPDLHFMTQWPSDIAFQRANPNLKLDGEAHRLEPDAPPVQAPTPATEPSSGVGGVTLVADGGANILVWVPGKMDEAVKLLNAGVQKTHPELLLVLLACRVPAGTTAIVTDGGFFSSDVLVTSGQSTGCRGTVDNSNIKH